VSKEHLVRGEDGVVRCFWGDSAPEYRAYHDIEWGFPVALGGLGRPPKPYG